mmetsp:Transcript_11658/g.31824  ORF Transcript_11658/g.31824 Transcript_11658/m.31824 type:complete len:250 (-) Transcript_11658:458-1207(-)
MPVHLFLLGGSALRVVVARAPLHRLDILLELLHQLPLPGQAVLELLRALLFLLVHDAVVLPHSLRLPLHLHALLLLALALIVHVLLEDLAHRLLRVLLLPLEAPLLGLHLLHNLLNEGGLLLGLSVRLFGLQLPLIVQLSITVLLLPHDLVVLLLLARLLRGLPPLELNHGIAVVPHLLALVILPPHVLLVHLLVEVHPELPLEGLHAELLPQGVLLVQVRRVLVQLSPVKRFWRVGSRLHDVHPRQGG